MTYAELSERVLKVTQLDLKTQEIHFKNDFRMAYLVVNCDVLQSVY